MTDAVVVGAGPNGLVAANLLADAGWDVVVVEAEAEPGGAVRSGGMATPGFVTDRFSAFYPFGIASPAIQSLRLERYGLRWVHAPHVLAHPTPDGRCAVLSRDVDETAASLEGYAAGDGDAWRRLLELWRRVSAPLLDALVVPFPPVRAGLRLASALRWTGAVDFARFTLLPVRRLAAEEFRGDGGGLLLAGNTLHTDLSPEQTGGAAFGWLLAMLGQTVGFPVPEGGSGRLTDALVRRLGEHGGRLICGARVERILVRGGRAVGVRTADGTEVRASRAVLADVAAPHLYTALLDDEQVPTGVRRGLRRFQWDHATVKVNWALSSPIPWASGGPVGAGTVHLADSLDDLTGYSAQLAMRHLPAYPFVVLGQMTTTDPSRSPPGTESVWAYTHVPQQVRADAGDDGLTGGWDEGETARFVARMEARVEAFAPGFRDRVIDRDVQTPNALSAADANLVGGAINGGTAQVHQQLLFRPLPGTGRPDTPIPGLFLASAGGHPGGGVHGAPGANAARAALAAAGPLGGLRARGWRTLDAHLRGTDRGESRA